MSERAMPSRHVIIADKAQRYWELTRLIAEARHAADILRDDLVQWINESREPIAVEGLPLLRVVERRSGRAWDLKALATGEPGEFQRRLDLGCLTVLTSLADAHVRAGNLCGMHRRYSWDTHTTALVFDGPSPRNRPNI